MGLANLDDFSLSENAQQQFYTIVENCKYMLGSNNKWKKRINLPDVLSKHFYNICYSLQESNDLSQASLLQQGIISAFLLLEEGYDFSQHAGNLEAMGKVIAKRGREEGKKGSEMNNLFSNVAESLRTDGEKPPHKNMVRARNYFAELAKQKLETDLSNLEKQLSDTHIRIPFFQTGGSYNSLFLEKRNFIDPSEHEWEEGEIDGIKIRKTSPCAGRGVGIIEILEGPYAGEQLFSFPGVYSAFKAGCYEYDTYYRAPNSQKHIDDIELFKYSVQQLTEIFPGYIVEDKNGELHFKEQGETVMYVWDFGCLKPFVIRKGEEHIETKHLENKQEFKTFMSIRAIRSTPRDNPHSYE